MAPIVAVVNKESQDQKLGIGMKTIDGVLVISNIVENGMFDNTLLKVGMEVKTVNNAQVSSTSEAISMLKEATGQITIIADDKPSGGPAPAADHSRDVLSPPGVAPGGQWGTNKYVGNSTQALACVGCLCCCLPGLCVLMCPIDERDVYKAKEGNKIYDASGNCLGHCKPNGNITFIPTKPTMKR